MDNLNHSKDRYIPMNINSYTIEEFLDCLMLIDQERINVCFLEQDYNSKVTVRVPYKKNDTRTLADIAYWIGVCHKEEIDRFIWRCKSGVHMIIERYENDLDRVYEKLCWYLNKKEAKLIIENIKSSVGENS